MRRAILLLMMSAGIALVVWSGWQNWRAARTPVPVPIPMIHSMQLPATPSETSSDSGESLLQGKPAPAFTLLDLNGKKVSLSDFKGRPLLINYWGTYCPPCKVEMPWLQEFSQKYASVGFAVIGVTYDSEVGRDTIARTTQKLGVTYPILLSTPKAEKDYLSNTEALPMSFYVDKAGKIIQVTAGLGSKDELESMVKETIASGGK
jgi:thiol-disulfide isomerase/thioredoxin